MKKIISVVTPCYNEEASIEACYEAIKREFDAMPGYVREHVFCDNCSSDATVAILKRIADADPCVKVIVNARNFGILKNTFNGVLAATGDAVLLFMPVDLQDPPELLPRFVELWSQGNEIVYGIRAERQEGFVMRNLRHTYYRTLSRLSYIDYPANVGDFQLVDRRVVEVMRSTNDAQPFMRMMTFDAGFKAVGVSYVWRERVIGKSQNPIRQLLDQGLLGLISFSNVPIRLALLAGVLISAFSICYALWVALASMLGWVDAPKGIPTLIVAMFFLGGIQLFFLGVLGEYILAIFAQVRKRPLVVERERVNFHADSDSPTQ